MIIIFNLIGIVMLAFSFGVAYAVTRLTGSPNETVFMILGGALAVVCDVTYRCRHPTGHWLGSSGGGSLFFLPVWWWGTVILAYFLTYAATGVQPSEKVLWTIIGVTVLAIVVVALARRTPAGPPPVDGAPSQDWECSRCGQQNPSYVRTCGQCHLQI